MTKANEVIPQVLTKKQNYRLWQSGAFGNKLRAWRTVEEWRTSGFKGKVALRTLLGGGGPCIYDLDFCKVDFAINDWQHTLGIPLEAIMINEAAPDADVVLQGEYLNDICQDEEGYALWSYFFYSTFHMHMRDALRVAHEETYGLRADLMLRNAMTPSSYDDWQILLDQYPGHVFEVSIYEHCLGDIPYRNALVWEIRGY
jgi:hypothetical protein